MGLGRAPYGSVGLPRVPWGSLGRSKMAGFSGARLAGVRLPGVSVLPRILFSVRAVLYRTCCFLRMWVHAFYIETMGPGWAAAKFGDGPGHPRDPVKRILKT